MLFYKVTSVFSFKFNLCEVLSFVFLILYPLTDNLIKQQLYMLGPFCFTCSVFGLANFLSQKGNFLYIYKYYIILENMMPIFFSITAIFVSFCCQNIINSIFFNVYARTYIPYKILITLYITCFIDFFVSFF